MASFNTQQLVALFLDHVADGQIWDIVIRRYGAFDPQFGGKLAFIFTFDHDYVRYSIDSNEFTIFDQPMESIKEALDILSSECNFLDVESFTEKRPSMAKGLSVIISSLALSLEFALAETRGFTPRFWEYEAYFEVGEEEDMYDAERATFTFTLD